MYQSVYSSTQEKWRSSAEKRAWYIRRWYRASEVFGHVTAKVGGTDGSVELRPAKLICAFVDKSRVGVGRHPLGAVRRSDVRLAPNEESGGIGRGIGGVGGGRRKVLRQNYARRQKPRFLLQLNRIQSNQMQLGVKNAVFVMFSPPYTTM